MSERIEAMDWRGGHGARGTALVASLIACTLLGQVGAAAAADDCATSRRKLVSARRATARLQARLRKLLTLASPSDEDKEETRQIHEKLGHAGDVRDALEAAVAACGGAGRGRATSKAKEPPAPAQAATPAAQADGGVLAPGAAAAGPGAPSAVTATAAPDGEEQSGCGGGPGRAEAPARPPLAPPALTTWRLRREHHVHRRRMVDWAAEAPQRCAAGAR